MRLRLYTSLAAVITIVFSVPIILYASESICPKYSANSFMGIPDTTAGACGSLDPNKPGFEGCANYYETANCTTSSDCSTPQETREGYMACTLADNAVDCTTQPNGYCKPQ